MRKERTVYLWIVGLTVGFILLAIAFSVVNAVCYNNTPATDCWSNKINEEMHIVNASIFMILFLLMVLTALPLCKLLKDISMQSSLNSNIKWISTVLMIFTLGFLLRSIIDAFSDFEPTF